MNYVCQDSTDCFSADYEVTLCASCFNSFKSTVLYQLINNWGGGQRHMPISQPKFSKKCIAEN